MEEINLINNVPLEIFISICYYVTVVLIIMALETLYCVKGEKKSKYIIAIYILGGPLFWYLLYSSKRKNPKKEDSIVAWMSITCIIIPLFMIILVYKIFGWGIDMSLYGDYINGDHATVFVAELMSFRSLSFLAIMSFSYIGINAVKGHQIYRKRIREEAKLYNQVHDMVIFDKMDTIRQYKPELLFIFDDYKQFTKEPVNIFNYIVYPTSIFICMLFAGVENGYRGYVYTLAIFISVGVIVVQPLFFNASSKYGEYNFVLTAKKLVKYIIFAAALLAIYMCIRRGIVDIAMEVSSDIYYSSMKIPDPHRNGEYIFAYGYIIGSIIVLLIKRPRMYLTEYRYVNSKGEVDGK